MRCGQRQRPKWDKDFTKAMNKMRPQYKMVSPYGPRASCSSDSSKAAGAHPDDSVVAGAVLFFLMVAAALLCVFVCS